MGVGGVGKSEGVGVGDHEGTGCSRWGKDREGEQEKRSHFYISYNYNFKMKSYLSYGTNYVTNFFMSPLS